MLKTLKKATSIVLALAMSLTMFVSGTVGASALLLDKGGIYQTDFDTREDALAAAD